MLFAQITDIHVGHEPNNPEEGNRLRLDAVCAILAELDPRPRFLLATGDLVENASPEVYARLRESLDPLPFPVWPMLGNHDNRDAFRKAFPEIVGAQGRIQYVIDEPELRIVVLDSNGDGRHGGTFDEAAADWLDRRIAERAGPVMIAIHHPPTTSGIAWLTADADEPWIVRLRDVVARHSDQVVAILAGHYHRPIITVWTHATMFVCPSVAPRAALDLREMDVEAPDGRAMIVAEPPAYALHHWGDGVLTTHVGVVGDFAVLARHDSRTKAMVQSIAAERAGVYGLAANEIPSD